MSDADGWLTFRQQKIDGPVAIPFNRPLPDFAKQADLDHLKVALAERASKHMTWITTESGSSRSQKSASQWFSAATRAAGINGGKSAHGLRATRAVQMAEAGATTNQIGAWTGHESLKEIDHYSCAANKKRLLDGPNQEQKRSVKDIFYRTIFGSGANFVDFTPNFQVLEQNLCQ